MMYAGLTISDKPALLEAKEKGFKTTKPFHQSIEEWNIDLALAQIEEMEKNQVLSEIIDSIENPKPLTWNERINQMTVEEKAEWVKEYLFDSACEGVCMYNGCNGACTENIIAFFNSPYTEGETK